MMAARQQTNLELMRKMVDPELDWNRPDAVIASEVGCVVATVRRYRRELGKPDPPRSPEAALVKPTALAVCYRASSNGVTRYNWAAVDWRMGDCEIANRLGCSRQRVSQVRKDLKIPDPETKHCHAGTRTLRMRIREYFDTNGVDARDYLVAQRLQCSDTTVSDVRRQLGLQAYKPPRQSRFDCMDFRLTLEDLCRIWMPRVPIRSARNRINRARASTTSQRPIVSYDPNRMDNPEYRALYDAQVQLAKEQPLRCLTRGAAAGNPQPLENVYRSNTTMKHCSQHPAVATSYQVGAILDACCAQLNVGLSDIRSDRRSKELNVARRLIVGALRHMTEMSFPEIARMLTRAAWHSAVHSQWLKFCELDDTLQAEWVCCICRMVSECESPTYTGWNIEARSRQIEERRIVMREKRKPRGWSREAEQQWAAVEDAA